MPVVKHNERISARVPDHVYRKLLEAAEIMGATVNQFLVQSAVEKAEAVLERELVIEMTKKDAKVFFDAVENPPPVNEKLAIAMKAYRKSFPNVENRGNQQKT